MATSTCGPSSLPPGDDSQSRQLLAEAASELAGEGDGPESMSAETQTALMADAGVQYAPPAASADPAELAAQLASAELAEFLEEAVPRCEAALQQNELLDALADELAALAEDEGEAGLGPGASAGSRSPASGLTETHTFSDLVHSKGCTLAGVAWHPGRRGVVAVSCTQQPGAAEPAVRAAEAASSRGAVVALQTSSRSGRKEHGRAATGQTTASTIPAAAAASTAGAGSAAQLQQPPPGCILVWSQSDAIHPDLVLQPPAQALAMAFDPSPPHSWLAAGLSTGQVALFNLQRQPPAGQAPAGAAAAAAGANAAVLPSVVGEAREDASRAAPLAPAFVSSADACHLAPITDLHWLPGVLVTRDGQLEAAAAPAATGGTAPMGAPSDGAATAADAAPAVAAACNLFATTSADGSLLVWDARISTRPRNTRGGLPLLLLGTAASAVCCRWSPELAHRLVAPCCIPTPWVGPCLRRLGSKSTAAATWAAPKDNPPVAWLCSADEEALAWKPALALGPGKPPLMATRFCPAPCAGPGRFLLGSLEGELALAEAALSLHEKKVSLEAALGLQAAESRQGGLPVSRGRRMGSKCCAAAKLSSTVGCKVLGHAKNSPTDSCRQYTVQLVSLHASDLPPAAG